MPPWVDIAPILRKPTAALGVSVAVPRGHLHVVLECARHDFQAGPALLQTALGPLVAAVVASQAASAARTLLDGLEAANRAVHDLGLRNPTTRECLVSAIAAYSVDGEIHLASAGACTAFVRSDGPTRELVESETEANKLMREGITADPIPADLLGSAEPVNGLGLAPAIFEIHQTLSLPQPDSYLLVLCGGRLAKLVNEAHIDALAPSGSRIRVARRLYTQFFPRLDGESAAVAVHQGRADNSADDRSRNEEPFPLSPGHSGWRIGIGLAVLIALAIAAVAYFLSSTGDRTPTGVPVPSPTMLLKNKPGPQDNALKGTSTEASDIGSRPQPGGATPEVHRATGADAEQQVTVLPIPDAPAGPQSIAGEDNVDKTRRADKKRSKRKKRAKRRKERKRTKSDEERTAEDPDSGDRAGQKAKDTKVDLENNELVPPEVAEIAAQDVVEHTESEDVEEISVDEASAQEEDQAGEVHPADAAVQLPAPEDRTEPEVQVLDFTEPEPEEEAPDASPTKRPFPAVKLAPTENIEL